MIVDSISVQNDAENICTKLANLKSVRRTSGDPPGKFLGIFGRNDLVGKYQKRLEDLEENVRMEQSDTTRSRQVHISTNFGLAQTMIFNISLSVCYTALELVFGSGAHLSENLFINISIFCHLF